MVNLRVNLKKLQPPTKWKCNFIKVNTFLKISSYFHQVNQIEHKDSQQLSQETIDKQDNNKKTRTKNLRIEGATMIRR